MTSTTTSTVSFSKVETFRLAQKKKSIAANNFDYDGSTLTSFFLAQSPTDLLFAGTKTGDIVFWQLGELNKHGGKRAERPSHNLTSASKHRGTLTALVYSESERFTIEEGKGLLFSGGADRLIKVWNIASFIERPNEPCMQVGQASEISFVSVSVSFLFFSSSFLPLLPPPHPPLPCLTPTCRNRRWRATGLR